MTASSAMANWRPNMFSGLLFLFAAGFCLQVTFITDARAQEDLTVEIEVNNTADPDDDYLCWSPMHVRTRILGVQQDDVIVVVSFEGLSSTSTGDVAFQNDDGTSLTWDNFVPSDELVLTLPSDGRWVSFLVAGKKASTNQKDVAIVVHDASRRTELASIPVMVRVRKDVRALTALERKSFLQAVRDLHSAGHFDKYWFAHQEAFDKGIHGMNYEPYAPLFLVWHRAFILNFERELQKINPDVTVPYWKFDEPSFLPGQRSIFSSDFLGEHVSGHNIVQFDDNLSANPNPWFDWRTSVSTRPLARDRHPDRQDVFDGVIRGPVNADELAKILADENNHRDAGGQIEFKYHNGPHAHVGGWITNRYAPADPLFFLLHANVDRAFAHWQEAYDAWDWSGKDTNSYHATGAHPGVGADYRKGSYALDEMWPWNSGQSGWPSGISFRMPAGVYGPDPAPAPTPASQIDYLNLSGKGAASGACYDDIGYVR